MNLFVLHADPAKAAAYHCDVHVVKQILECGQLLSAASQTKICKYPKSVPKHPCTLWVAETRDNYRWTLMLMASLSGEYTRRYGKVHAYRELIHLLDKASSNVPDGRQTAFVQCMPDEFIHSNYVTAYRNYYKHKAETFKRPMTWRVPAHRPRWMAE